MVGSPLILDGAPLVLALFLCAQAQDGSTTPRTVESSAQTEPEVDPHPDPPASGATAAAHDRHRSDPIEPDDSLAPYRLDFDTLTARVIGTASRPVLFNWRRTHLHVGATGSYLVEQNNFLAGRGGVVVRLPSRRILLEGALTYADSADTRSSRLLALTPYRQAGRPSRVELDVGIAMPVAEGIVTVYPRWFPALQLTFEGVVSLRYAYYFGSMQGLRFQEVASRIFAPQLSEEEIDNLEPRRLAAMAVDPARYHLLVGAANTIYLQQGLFVRPMVLLAVPLLVPVTDTDLLFWPDLSLSIGVAL